jgi:hypothetical protein
LRAAQQSIRFALLRKPNHDILLHHNQEKGASRRKEYFSPGRGAAALSELYRRWS